MLQVNVEIIATCDTVVEGVEQGAFVCSSVCVVACVFALLCDVVKFKEVLDLRF